MKSSYAITPQRMVRPTRRPSGSSRPRGPWKHGPIPVIGLIGGIGAGKSSVAALLAQRGAVILDADAIGHALLDQTPAREQVLARFGDEVRDRSATPGEPPRVDRRTLGSIVFAEPDSLRALEAILHPRMRKTFLRAIARAARQGRAKAVVLDAAVLFEARWNDLCDIVVFVDATWEQRLARVTAGRGWNAETVAARERAQQPLDQKKSRANLVLSNDGDSDGLAAEVDRLWSEIKPPRRSAVGPARSPDRPSTRREN